MSSSITFTFLQSNEILEVEEDEGCGCGELATGDGATDRDFGGGTFWYQDNTNGDFDEGAFSISY